MMKTKNGTKLSNWDVVAFILAKGTASFIRDIYLPTEKKSAQKGEGCSYNSPKQESGSITRDYSLPSKKKYWSNNNSDKNASPDKDSYCCP
jgi:hypothetical protein